MDIVTLTTYSETVQAELAKVFLESEGIACFVVDSTTNNLKIFGGVSSGVRLQVFADDVERARNALDRFAAENPTEFDEEALMAAFEQDAADRKLPPRDESSRAISAHPVPEASDDASGPDPTCPTCGSWRLVRERDLGFGLYALTVLLLGLPLLFIKPKVKCKQCGTAAR